MIKDPLYAYFSGEEITFNQAIEQYCLLLLYESVYQENFPESQENFEEIYEKAQHKSETTGITFEEALRQEIEKIIK